MSELSINFSGSNEFPSHLRMLLAGQAGVGKTTFASEFPNPFWVNAACGLATLAKIGGIPYVNFSKEMDLFAVKQLIDSGRSEEFFGRKIETLVIDSIDELQRLLLVERLKNENRSETKLEDWGWLSNRLHAIFAGICQLPVHVIFISHIKEVSVFENTIFKPALAGQFCEHIHEYVDMSLLMHASTISNGDVVEVARWIVSTPQYEAEWVNDKTGRLPIRFTPSIEHFFGDVDLEPSYNVKINISGESVENIPESDKPEINTTIQESSINFETREKIVKDFLNDLKRQG